VVVINGGPGATLIDQDANAAYPLGAVPAGRFNIVYVDHRGSGCNTPASGEFPDEAFRSEYVARDVLAAIKALRLSRYIVFGNSFGTVVRYRSGQSN
jgi:pimeloyl-ACP methyl ester carboxylesterase